MLHTVEYIIGSVLALCVAVFAAVVGFGRERSLGTAVLLIVASYYVLFALMADSRSALITELIFAGGFVLVAVLGSRKLHWIVPAAIVGHGVFDFFHHSFIENPGVPAWWPGFCMSFDVVFGAWLTWEVVRQRARDANASS